MNLSRTITASVYVVYENKVLLHMHKKHNTLFPLGGHMLPNEVPHETALREVWEESGLEVKLYNSENKIELGSVRQLNKPMHLLLENVGQEVENIDFIYFATSTNINTNPQEGESKELYWLSKEEIENNNSIKVHVKTMALNALEIIKK